ncbi:MAG: 16S rRNA (cytosine(1402)-N(4))-methyltransferase RsmH [Myxococcota bacterium]|jgi:16S rRNA (cytosine1402-N4)-methyltransferase
MVKRPDIQQTGHLPVMALEAVTMLNVRPGGVWVDVTLGGGGHAEMILDRSAPDGILLGIDLDGEALDRCGKRLKKFGDRFYPVHANYADAAAVLERSGLGKADGALADLGVSSFQLDAAGRGFSFSKPGPVDMRMDAGSGPTAMDLIVATGEKELARLLGEFGGERMSGRVARAIKQALSNAQITDTASLAAVVEKAAWKSGGLNPATRTFQALRIAVNRELESLAGYLNGLPSMLKHGGRAVVISFHSLEDRAVKKAFAGLAEGCICPKDMPVCACGRVPRARLLTRGAAMPSEAETAENPRSRSARLRAMELC